MTDACPSQFSSGKVKMGHISASAGLFPFIIIPVRLVRACVSVVNKERVQEVVVLLVMGA